MTCIMCKKEFEEKDLDFVGRCLQCFRDYVNGKKDVDLGIPFSKKINYDWPN